MRNGTDACGSAYIVYQFAQTFGRWFSLIEWRTRNILSDEIWYFTHEMVAEANDLNSVGWFHHWFCLHVLASRNWLWKSKIVLVLYNTQVAVWLFLILAAVIAYYNHQSSISLSFVTFSPCFCAVPYQYTRRPVTRPYLTEMEFSKCDRCRLKYAFVRCVRSHSNWTEELDASISCVKMRMAKNAANSNKIALSPQLVRLFVVRINLCWSAVDRFTCRTKGSNEQENG